MMMAHDSTSNRPQLSAESIAALKSSLEMYLANETDPEPLQTTLRRIAAEAREKKMHAEQLLVALKDVWFALPQIAKAAQGEQQSRLLQKVVTLCIREYYSV
jgi:hypothetical protein